jgi:hypothetical protein|tara:strand:- start:614 stop:769 length:156 start_codon:yes stop_codon:yes gene_type:complete
VQPALVTEQYASIVLHALALVVTKIARLQPVQNLETLTRILQILYDDANVL